MTQCRTDGRLDDISARILAGPRILAAIKAARIELKRASDAGHPLAIDEAEYNLEMALEALEYHI